MMTTIPEDDGPREAEGKLQIRYGEEERGGPLLVFHPLTACLLAGSAAGLLAFAVGEMAYGAFEAEAVPRTFQGVTSSLPTPETWDAAMAKNAILAGLGLGALLGLFLGLAGGMVRGDVRRGLIAGGAGLVLGSLAGGLLPALALLPALRLRDRLEIDPLVIGSTTEALLWGPIAAAAGAAFGFGIGGRKAALKLALSAFGGALIATLVYAAAGAAFFPLAETDRPVATERGARLMAHMLVALGAATAVGLGFAGRRRKPAEPTVSVTQAAS